MKKIRISPVLYSVGISLVLCTGAYAQLAPGTQIDTRLRPAVWLQYGAGPAGADQTAVGIFDSGDSNETLSRETSTLLGVNPVTPLNPNAALARSYNQGATGQVVVTSGGWLGATLDLERNTQNPLPAGTDLGVRAGDPAHVFTNADVTRTAGSATAAERLWYLDYNRNVDNGNNGFTENHTSMSFVTTTNPANNLVVEVDPINGTPLPFHYDNSNGTNAGLFDGNGRNVLDPATVGGNNPGALSLDQKGSSVSYFTGANARVPTQAKNANPGFVTFVDLTPIEFSSTLVPTNGGAGVVVNGALPAGTRNLTVNVTVANGANVTQLLPRSQNGTYDPEYQPGNAANGLVAYTGFTLTVATGLDRGGQVNPNGFVRTDGSVNIQVVDAANTVVLPSQNIVLPSQAPRPFASVNGTNFLVDTGAPGTSVPAAIFAAGTPTANPNVNLVNLTFGGMTLNNVPVTQTAGTPILGTDVTNRFGQFWDFRNVNPNNHGVLTLIGPTLPDVVAATGNGIIFNVDQNTTGLARTGVEQEKLYGSVPQLQINAATEAGIGGGDGVPNQAQGTVFRTHLTGSNASYIDENATGLTRGAAGPAMDGSSLGADAIGIRSQLYFSVSPSSNGLAGSDMAVQKARNQSASDIYTATGTPNSRAGGANKLFINQEVMGLGPNFGPLVNATPSNDNLTDFDLFTGRAMPAVSMSNLDSPIEVAGDSGTAARARVSQERYAQNFDLYFSIKDMTGKGATIFRSNVSTSFATAGDMGLSDQLNAGFDDISSLALFRPSVGAGVIGGAIQRGLITSSKLEQNFNFGGGFFVFDPNNNGAFEGIDMFHGAAPTDLALFTLAPDSEALNFFGLSSADVFITDFDGTFTLYATAQSLGLQMGDAIDGLDSIPEPASLVLLLVVGVMALCRRRPAVALAR